MTEILVGHALDVLRSLEADRFQACVTSPHLDPHWLLEQYVWFQRSTYDLGREVRRDPKRVYEKLRDFGVPTRPRGTNLTRRGGDCYATQPGFRPQMTGRHHTEATRRRLSVAASVPKPYLRGDRNGMARRRGPLSPTWKGGVTPERQAVYGRPAWKAVAAAVRARDRGCCRRCGDHKQGHHLHIHHIAQWPDAPDKRMDADNLVCLCAGCHRWVHSRANTERSFLEVTASE